MYRPAPRDLFSTNDPVQITTQYDEFTEELNKSWNSPKQWTPGGPQMGAQESGTALLEKALGSADVLKSVSPETVESIRSQIQLAQADVGKDWTLTNPISTGLVAYDLEAPSKKLFPYQTPLRNRIPRKKGIGTSHLFKVISSISGSQTGVADLHPGITDSTTTVFGASGGPAYMRGPKISYAGYDVAVGYSQFGLSDQVNWSAQFSSQGYEDLRQLSQTSLLYSSMLEEEKMIIAGRGSGSGFLGALANTAPTIANRSSLVAGETAYSGGTTNIYVMVAYDAGPFGTSTLSTAASVAVTASNVADVTIPYPAGAVGAYVFVGTGGSLPANSAFWLAGRTTSNVFTIKGALPTTGTAASTITVDKSAYAAGYDGILATCLGPKSGYVNRTNAVLNAANPGNEFFKAFDVMYQANGADPDEILCNGSDRRQLSDLLKTSSSSNYQIMVPNPDDVHSATIGALVVALQNEVTSKTVNLSVSRFLPQGTMPIISWTLPIPDSNVSDVWEMRLVQDYMAIQWTPQQFAYESSSYWYGALICPAPAWNGAITGIQAT